VRFFSGIWKRKLCTNVYISVKFLKNFCWILFDCSTFSVGNFWQTLKKSHIYPTNFTQFHRLQSPLKFGNGLQGQPVQPAGIKFLPGETVQEKEWPGSVPGYSLLAKRRRTVKWRAFFLQGNINCHLLEIFNQIHIFYIWSWWNLSLLSLDILNQVNFFVITRTGHKGAITANCLKISSMIPAQSFLIPVPLYFSISNASVTRMPYFLGHSSFSCWNVWSAIFSRISFYWRWLARRSNIIPGRGSLWFSLEGGLRSRLAGSFHCLVFSYFLNLLFHDFYTRLFQC